ncbi:MAG: tape measure protein [Tepidisphaeraceae bacterium]
MAKTISTLATILTANAQPFVDALQSTTAPLRGFMDNVTSAAGTIAKLTGAAALVSTAFEVFGSVKDSISLAAELEQNAVAFETMLGSADAAKTVMQQLQDFAAATPFEFPELAKSAKSLLAFGVSADRILPSLKAIGDISSGIGAPVAEIAEIFGKAKVQGTLFAEDINQLVGRGIPVIQQFAKQLGVSEGQVKKLASEGQINFGMLQKAFTDLTSSGGQFAGMMEKQSHTLGGMWSTLTDTVSMTLAGIVTQIVETFSLKDGLSALLDGLGTASAYITAGVAAWAPVLKGWAVSTWQTLTGIWDSIYGTVAPVVTDIAGWVVQNFNTMVATAAGYWASLYNFTKAVLGATWSIVSTVGANLSAVWQSAMESVGLSTSSTGTIIGDVFAAVQGVSVLFQKTVTLTLNTLAFSLENLGNIAAFVFTGAAYQAVKFGNEIAYVFTDVIGGTLSWIGRNWQQIFVDIGNFQATVFSNMLKNAADFAKALWSAIKGDGFNFEFTGLTEGFKSSLQELPVIAERQIGGLEKMLGDESAILGQTLAEGYSDYMNNADREAKSAANSITGGIQDALASIPTIKLPDPPTLAVNADTAGPDAMTAALNKTNKAAKDTADALKLTVAGSAEALSGRAGSAAEMILADARKAQGGTGTTAGGVAASPGAVASAPPAVIASRLPDIRPNTGNTESKIEKLLSSVVLLVQQVKTEAATVARNTEALPEVAAI